MPASHKRSKLRIGYRYRPDRLKGPYRAIVIGSGMGGLTVAGLLSDLGWKVAVMEQHYTAGGYTHSYERDGYEWDVGLHYVGDMGASTLPWCLMDHLCGGRLKWAPMAERFESFHFGDKVFDAAAGARAFRDNLVRQFPSDRPAIDRYVALLKQVKRALPVHAMSRLLKPWQRKLLQPLLRWACPPTLFRLTSEVLGGLTANVDLLATLTGQWVDLGLRPSQSAFFTHAAIAAHYLEGGYYPVGGSWRIAEAIVPKIRAAGGEVFTYARVEEILVENGRVRGVRMGDGTRIDADCVISGAGVFNTFEHLIPSEAVRQAGHDGLLSQLRPSSAHLGVYVGLQGSAEALGLPRSNLCIFPGTDHDANMERFLSDPSAPFPVVYISFPSAKDPEYALRHPERSTIEIVAPVPFEWFQSWQGSTWGKRGAKYEAFKAEFGERLMAVLYEKLPHLRGKVDYYEVSTPLSTSWFNAHGRGEMYGVDHTPQRFAEDSLGPRTRISGLWLTGQDTFICGVVGAMIGGMVAACGVAGLRQMAPLLGRILMRRHPGVHEAPPSGLLTALPNSPT